jgi:hypothetical protein
LAAKHLSVDLSGKKPTILTLHEKEFENYLGMASFLGPGSQQKKRAELAFSHCLELFDLTGRPMLSTAARGWLAASQIPHFGARGRF